MFYSHPINHSSCQKTRMNDLSCGVRMWAQVSFVLSQSTRLTERQTERPWQYCALHHMQSYSKKHFCVCCSWVVWRWWKAILLGYCNTLLYGACDKLQWIKNDVTRLVTSARTHHTRAAPVALASCEVMSQIQSCYKELDSHMDDKLFNCILSDKYHVLIVLYQLLPPEHHSAKKHELCVINKSRLYENFT